MLTDQEKLAIVEKQLRKRRVSAKQTASLMRQHERLTKKIAGVGPGGRPPKVQSPDEEYDYVFMQLVYGLEAERSAAAKAARPGMTEEEGFAYLRSKGLTREEFEAYSHRKVKLFEQRLGANRVIPELSPAPDPNTPLDRHGFPLRPTVKPVQQNPEVKADVE